MEKRFYVCKHCGNMVGMIKEMNRMEKRFYVCKHCGNMVGMIKNAGVPIICCGEPMAELTANTVEAAQEKHLPVYTMEGGVLKVQVGSAEHPMLAEHYNGTGRTAQSTETGRQTGSRICFCRRR